MRSRRGAAAVLGSRPTGVPSVVVDDVQAALQELARVVLQRLREREAALTVVAVTGSQGKTTAKDMLARVLADAAPTVATAGSFNNELGLPLTVLRAGEDTRFLVLEMGARGVGHLRDLCEIAPPDISLVLNVGRAHIGEFGSQEQIAVAKGELVEALPADGYAVLNLDDPLVAAMRGAPWPACSPSGGPPGPAYAWTGWRSTTWAAPPSTWSVTTRAPTSRCSCWGSTRRPTRRPRRPSPWPRACSLAEVAASLGAISRLSRWRMELHERADGVVVVNDAYNANPDSMRAALETLARMGTRRRTIAVLGEMRELGESSSEEHRTVGAAAHALGIDQVVVVGEGARGIRDALVEARGEDGTTRQVDTVDEAAAWLSENVAGSDIVLVKASRSGRLERVAELLVAGTGPTDGPAREETRR